MMYTDEHSLRFTIQMLVARGASKETVDVARDQLKKVEELNILHGATLFCAELVDSANEKTTADMNMLREGGLTALQVEDLKQYEEALELLKGHLSHFRTLYRSKKK